MPDRQFDLAAEWDGIHSILTKIRSHQSEFHAFLFDALDKMEQTGIELLNYQDQSPEQNVEFPQNQEVEQQIERLTETIAELTHSLTNHKQMLVEERSNWMKDFRSIQAQYLSQQQTPKHSNFSHRKERS